MEDTQETECTACNGTGDHPSGEPMKCCVTCQGFGVLSAVERITQATATLADGSIGRLRTGERTYTLRHHPVDGYFAFAHCVWCRTSLGSADPEAEEMTQALGWHRTMKAAISIARVYMDEHAMKCEHAKRGVVRPEVK